MFAKHSQENYQDVMDGIRLKTLVHGRKTLMAEFRLRQSTILPPHYHPHEQTGYLVQGRLRLTMGDTSYEVEPGDSWCIPEGIIHGAEALEDSVAIEVFAPVREEYLPENLE